MRRRGRPLIAVIAAGIAALALTGCVRFQLELTVQPDDTVDGTVVVAAIVGDGDDAEQQAAEVADRIEEALLPGLRGAPGVTREVYREDGYLGSRFTVRGAPLEAFAGGDDASTLRLAREGDEIVFSGVLDFTPDDDAPAPEDADTSGITVQLTFPGEVISSNGEVSGRTVRWSTSYEERIEMDARASAVPAAPLWPWIAGGAVAALLAAVVVVIVVRARPSRT